MEEDIKNIEEMLEFKEDIIKYHAWVGTKLINSVENLLKRYKNLEEENKHLKDFIDEEEERISELGNKNCELELMIEQDYIPISVIQNTLDDINEKIEEFTKNVVTTKEEIEQEYWKSELNKAIAKRNVLQEILEKGNK